MALLRLYETELGSFTCVKPVLTVQLNDSIDHKIGGNSTSLRGTQTGPVEIFMLGYHFVTSKHPEELLARVIEIQLDRRACRLCRDGEGARVLHLLNEVLHRSIHKTASLLHIQIDLVTPELTARELCRLNLPIDIGKTNTIPESLERCECQVDTDLVVLECKERQIETGISHKPETKRHL